MWVHAGFEPDSFWGQTPATFQACMAGVRKRLEQQQEDATALAWQVAAMNAAAKSRGGLKPLRHYVAKAPRKMTPAEMLANMRIIAQRVNRREGQN